MIVLDPATQSAIDAGNVVLPSNASDIKISEVGETASFKDIIFKAEGTYKFIVREKDGEIPGVIYDSARREVVVTVTDKDNDGSLKVSYTITDGKTLTFTNVYDTTTTEISGHDSLVIEKFFSGRDDDAWLSSDVFTFELAAADDTTKAAVTAGTVVLPDTTLEVTAANKAHAHFGNITFHEPGRYTFTVIELDGGLPGITYDATSRKVVVDVVDNNDGTLSARLNRASERLAFVNKYNKANVEIVKSQAVNGGKATTEKLTVRENDKVTYYLTVTNNGQGDASYVTVTDKIPSGLTLVANSISNGGTLENGVITWNLGTIKAGAEKVVSFTVEVPDVTVDTTWENAATVKYYQPGDDPEKEQPDTDESNEVEIEEGVPNVTIAKSQSVNGGEATTDILSVEAGDVITYVLTVTTNGTEPADNVVVTDKVPAGLNVTSISDNGTVSNGVITWNLGTMAAKAEKAVSFTVTVPDTEDEFTKWTNIATANYPNDPDDDPEESNPVTSVNSADAYIIGQKTVTGDRNAAADGEFSFKLQAVTSGAPMPANATVKNAEDGTFTFGPITYSEAGTFIYKITEVNAGETIKGVTYDDTVYYAVVTVGEVESTETDEDGNVTSTATSYEVKGITYHKGSANSAAEEGITFTNTYYDADVSISKSQAVNGKAVDDKDVIVREGDKVTYTLTVKNSGKGTASNVIVKDTVPAGLTLDEIGNDGTEKDGVITWNLGTLAAGESKKVSFTVTVPDVTEDTEWTNIATVTYTNPDDPDHPEDPEESNEVEVEEKTPEVSIKKLQQVNDGDLTDAKLEVKKGDVVTYYITVENAGGEVAENVEIKDAVPAGLTLVKGSISNDGVEKDGVITWNLDSLAAGKSVTVSFEVTVPSVKEDTTWKNVATVDFENDPEDPDGKEDPEPSNEVEVEEGVPSVTIEKAQSVNGGKATKEKADVKAGDEVTYSITVKNAGTGVATDVVIKDEIPAGLTLVKDSITNDGTEKDGVITWNIAELPEGESVTVNFTVTVPEVKENTTWKNVATVVYGNDPEDPEDPEPSNEVEVEEGIPAVTAEKTQSVNGGKETKDKLSVKDGDKVTYYITVKNTGKGEAKGIEIKDEIPEGLVLVTGSVSHDGTVENGIITWNISELAVNGEVKVSFTVTVPDVEKDTTWKNVATVAYGNDPEDPDEPTPTNPVEVEEGAPVVSIEKTQSVNGGKETKETVTVRENDEVTYYITVKNAGTETAKGVEIKDAVPTGLTVIENSITNGGSLADGNITWNFAELAAGEEVKVSFTVTVPDVTEDTTWKNVATVAYENDPEDPDEPTPSNPVEVEEGTPDVSIEKSQSVEGTVREGDEVTYYITVKNNGTEVAEGIEIKDEIPAGLILVDGSISDEGTEADGIIIWQVAELAAGAEVTVSFKVTVPDVTEDTTWRNIATVVYENDPEDPDEPTPSNPVEFEEGTPDVQIEKAQSVNDGVSTTEKLTVNEDDKVTYYITVKNAGTEVAEGIVITDEIPEGLTLVDDSITEDGTASDGVVTWKIDKLEAGEEITVSFTVLVPEVSEDTVWENVATVVYENDPENPDEPIPSNPVEVEEIPEIPEEPEVPEEPETPVEPEEPAKPAEDKAADTGDSANVISYMILLMTALGVAVVVKKRNNIG